MNNDLQETHKQCLDLIKDRLLRNEQPKNWLDRLKNLATILSSIAVPIILAMTGYHVNLTLQKRNSETQMIEMAVGILAESPQESEMKHGLRSWAVSVINEYSDVPLSESASEALISERRLPLSHITWEDLESIYVVPPKTGHSD